MEEKDIYCLSGKILYSNDKKYIKILGTDDGMSEYYYYKEINNNKEENEVKTKLLTDLIQNYLVLKPAYVLSVKEDLERKSSRLILNSYKKDKLVYIFNINSMENNVINCLKVSDDYSHNHDQTPNISSYPFTISRQYGYLNTNSFDLLNKTLNLENYDYNSIKTELEILINNWIATNFNVYNFDRDFDLNIYNVKTMLQSIIPNSFSIDLASCKIKEYTYDFDINEFKKENPSHNIILINFKNSSHIITYTNTINSNDYDSRYEQITGFSKEELDQIISTL